MDPGLQMLLQTILNKQDSLEEKVDSLLRFMWQIIGGTGIVAIFATIVFQVILAIIQRGG